MKIITLTLNPAIDVHCEADNFEAMCENFVAVTSKDAGGKGINISRALLECNISNKAYVFLGYENGKEFLDKISEEGLDIEALFTPGRIRENITIHTKGQRETRISFSGFLADDTLIDRLKEKLLKEELLNSIITLTGSVPDGVKMSKIKKLILMLKSKGAKIVLDSRSFTKDDIKDVSPWLIKPNKDELKLYDDSAGTDEKIIALSKKLCMSGVENVLISLGEKGAILSNANGSFYARAPEVDAVSTIGAGDSMIAGFVAAKTLGMTDKEALALAVSFGSAACMEEGTKQPEIKNIKSLYSRVLVTEEQ